MSILKAARRGIDEGLGRLYNGHFPRFAEDPRDLGSLERYVPDTTNIKALEEELAEVFQLAHDAVALDRGALKAETQGKHRRIEALRDLLLDGKGTGLPVPGKEANDR